MERFEYYSNTVPKKKNKLKTEKKQKTATVAIPDKDDKRGIEGMKIGQGRIV